ncbi:outer membrane protein assembly factor BamB family protein [Halocatena salina]|uniref:PQQ-like beta-propeller repeat protein n=1 Tax=Halocatena salina TaxID=2934340 RepID=A0A8U0A2G0_9EURY|nr:PQQ-binding-like beta-propeller repeat protein [Halocatena salina]UPM43036.1 PQQ-like beta-propeller repeat protein [Halocatena salina]
MSTIDQLSRRHILTTMGSCLGGVLAGCVGASSPTHDPNASKESGSWPTVGHDPANTRHASRGTVNSQPTKAWQFQTGLPTDQPVVAEGQVYIPDSTGLHVLDAVTGSQQWTHTTDANTTQLYTAPTVRNGVVYLGVTKGAESVVALDATSGERLWTFEGQQTGAVSGTPTLNDAGDALYVGTDTEQVYALDPATGEQRWQQTVLGSVTTSLAVDSPLVVVTTRSGEVYAFEENGTTLWRQRLQAGSETPPVISDRTVFAGGTNNNVYSLDPITGNYRWTSYVNTLYQHGFAVRNSSVYAVSGRNIVVLGGDEGDKGVTIDLGEFIRCAPILLDDTLYVGGRRLFALDPSGGIGIAPIRFGATRWSMDLGQHVGPGVAATTERLFVPVKHGDGTHELVALHET